MIDISKISFKCLHTHTHTHTHVERLFLNFLIETGYTEFALYKLFAFNINE